MSRKLVVVWSFLACLVLVPGQADLGLLSEQLENSLMKKLLGHWQIADSSIDAAGQWQDGPGASWHFYPILNGHAVQDDWVSPPLTQAAPAAGRQYGTNIRIFNPKKNQWEMAWASVKGQQVDTFVATENEQQIVMTGLFSGRQSRITFYDIKADSFAWKLEFQQADDTSTWSEVYRIKGKRLGSVNKSPK